MPDLPPLNALRAFEVAARTGSFVQAGVELGVTAAAVSLQVKLLEEHLGKKLFQRQGNRIVLTDAGRTVYPRLERALSDIADMTAEVRSAQARAPLVISVLPSMAELWLMPRLCGFHTGRGIEVRVEDDPVVFARDGVDLRVTYGAALYADHRVEMLFSDRFVPVCAPGFPLPDGLARMPDAGFIHTDWGPAYATQPSWAAWLAHARIRRTPDPAAGLRVGLTSLAIAAAREGLGVALAPRRIAGSEIATGRLVVPVRTALPMSDEYVLVFPHALQHRRVLMSLVAHLKALA